MLTKSLWRFHRKHSDSIILTNNGMAVEVRGNFHGSRMVFSNEPVQVNMLYEVQVEIGAQYNARFVGFGLVTEDPATMTDLPAYITGLHSAIVVFNDDIYVHKHRIPHDVNIAYENIKVGSRIGVLVDTARCLHIYVDGKDQGIFYSDVQHPCWVVVEMCFCLRKMTALPLTSVS